MYRVLITDNLSPQALERLDEAKDATYDVVHRPALEKLKEIIGDYDAVIVRSSVRVDEAILAAGERLKVVGRAGVGLDNVDVEAASLRGVIVMNTPGANTVATAEHTMALLLALCRNLALADASMRRGEWNRSKFMGVQLYGKVLGIVGLGRIGVRVAQRAQGFDMKVVAYDPYISDEVARELKVRLVELDELLAESDFITLHTALTAETRGLIDAETLARTKKGVRLVNCARGALIDEEALVEALQSGHVAGAAIDVYVDEPLTEDSALRRLPNVVLTPHLAASTEEAQRDVGTQVVDQVLAALRGEDYRNAVNMPVVDAGVFRELKPYLELAEKLGSLQMQLSEGRIKRVEVEFHGEEIEDHVKPLTVALLKGLLDPIADTPVNYISAPHLAMQRGISVSETRGLPALPYPNLLSCQVEWDGGERLVSGSLLGREFPRVVQIDGFRLDAQPTGIILVMESADVPGVVGRVGTLLGEHNVNIAQWRMGQTASYSQERTPSINISFINLDTPISPQILDELIQLEKVYSVRQVIL